MGADLPSFSLRNQHGDLVRNADFTGSWLIVYFYPKDDTPGCTLESKTFSAARETFAARGIEVVGVSADSVASHQDFCDKHALSVSLLADPEARLLSAAGIGQVEWQGVSYWNRTTVIVDPSGRVAKIYQDVEPESHAERVYADTIALQGSWAREHAVAANHGA
jgi:peroxiredoxin Q/BCP